MEHWWRCIYRCDWSEPLRRSDSLVYLNKNLPKNQEVQILIFFNYHLSSNIYHLTQVRFQRPTIPCFLQTLDGSFLDLADTLFSQVVFMADLLDRNSILPI